MYTLNLPAYEFKIVPGKPPQIFDAIRKKYVSLTPEEWVRQHFLRFLMEEKGYPAGLIFIEKQLNLHQMKRRCDAVVYNNVGEPILIMEFKKPDATISQVVFDQIARYNMAMQVKYLMVSNGMRHYCCRLNYQTHSYEFLEDIPTYSQVLGV